MLSAVRSLGTSLDAALRALARQRLLLCSLLILCNAVFIPYLGLVRDAQLYSGLVLHRLDPDFLSADLFFKYGSQDQYTLFSPLMAPLAYCLGIKGAFFAGYAASVALFLAAMVRLTTRLWPDSPAAIVGLLYLAIVTVAYGGEATFYVIEPFLTARLPACALTIWAFAEYLDHRWLRVGLCLALAFAIHPLMTFPGVLVLAIVVLAGRWGMWGVLLPSLAGIGALASILAFPPLAQQLFGHFDAEWLELTALSNSYQFPLEWTAQQWYWNLFGVSGLAAGAWFARSARPERCRVLAATALVGFVGLLGALLFTQLPYALLHKGQAYRWLWLSLALMPPAVVDLAWTAWQTNRLTCRLVAIAIALTLGLSNFIAIEFACAIAFVPVVYFGAVIFAKQATMTDKISWALLGGAAVGFAMWGAFRTWLFLSVCLTLRSELTVPNQWQVVFASLARGVLLPLLLVAVARAGSRLFGRRRVATFAALAVCVWVGLYFWLNSECSQAQSPPHVDLRFVEQFLNRKRIDEGRPMGIYSNLGKLDRYWVDWRVRSFYDPLQSSGFVFNRETAIEGKRRAVLVAPFEAAAIASHWDMMTQRGKDRLEAWLDTSLADSPGPQASDLLRIANEESVDYIVLFHAHFDDLACARHGDASIYDCRRLRETTRVAAR